MLRQALRLIGKAFLILVGYAVFTLAVDALRPDYRRLKVEEFYPNGTALEEALYAKHPIGSDLVDLLVTLQKSQLPVTTGSGMRENYVFKSSDATHVMFFHRRWEDLIPIPCVIYRANIQVEYNRDQRIVGIHAAMGERACEWAI
jgi:hypothetical protein